MLTGFVFFSVAKRSQEAKHLCAGVGPTPSSLSRVRSEPVLYLSDLFALFYAICCLSWLLSAIDRHLFVQPVVLDLTSILCGCDLACHRPGIFLHPP